MSDAAKRILVVDDDPEIVGMLKEYLEQRSSAPERYVVETAANGKDALKSLVVRPPDLVILDIDMPGVSGLEVLKRIRALDPRLPVVMLTANEDTSVAAQTLRDGASSYAPKPLNFKYLDHLVAVFTASPRRT